MKSNTLIKEAEAQLPTDWGTFRIVAFKSNISDYDPELVLVHPELDVTKPVIIRVHSECITGDLFHSQRCDCGRQLESAMQIIAEYKGILIYLRQEGRGIGIVNKLKAYNKQDEGLDTIEANEALGFKADDRDYKVVIKILEHFGINQVKLLTNNPEKISAFNEASVELIERLPLEIKPSPNNSSYLKTKKEEMGHLLKHS